MNRKSTSPPGNRAPERAALVTGGAGFVGSHLCRLLLENGFRVTALDDLSTGSEDNVAGLAGRGDFRLVVGTAADPAVASPLVREAGLVFHLAAAVGVGTIMERQLHSLETNVFATHAVLEAAAESGCPVVFTSTSEVYGKNERVPFSEAESDIVLGPTSTRRWGYACSKALDEFFCLAYARERGLPVVVARLFNTIGPRQTGRYGMVVPRFIGQALRGEPLTVFGDGGQVRCFTFVDDVVSALLALGRKAREVPGGIYNIGTREETTILDLANRVRTLCRSRSEISFVPAESVYGRGFEDMHRRVPDLSRIEALVGYAPKVRLDEALEKTIRSAAGGND